MSHNRILLYNRSSQLNNELQQAFDRLSEIKVTLSIFMASLPPAAMQQEYDIALIICREKEDVYRLIPLINLKKPYLPIILVCPPELDTEDLSAMNISHIMHTPIAADEVAQKIRKQLQERAKGELHGLNLTSVLQLINTDRKSCTVVVKTTTAHGELHVREGEIVAATTDDKKGFDAACDILSWDNVTIALQDTHRHITREIDQPFMSLIMEAMRRKDEISLTSDRSAAEVPPERDNQKQDVENSTLVRLLESFSEVVEFSIFGAHEKPVCAHAHRPQTPIVHYPNELEQGIEKFGGRLRLGRLKSMSLNDKGSVSYLFFPYQSRKIAVGLRKNQSSTQFLNKFTEKVESSN